ncbi:MAG: AAA family ATPase [Bacteroidota bacterium]
MLYFETAPAFFVSAMITRLQVDGFKNLLDVDIRFGPFTCIAGANGVGKSNLFDAISFLSRLADSTLNEAASRARDPEARSGDLRSLFTLAGHERSEVMKFGVEMVVPREATDDLNQLAKASITLLRYDLHLVFEEGDQVTKSDRLAIRYESLVHLNRGGTSAKRVLPFLRTSWSRSAAWRKDALLGKRNAPFVSTVDADGQRLEQQDASRASRIQRHQEGNQGRPYPFDMATLPRTVLSTANALESPTMLVARREMQSWSLLHFEPSALRSPDDFRAPGRMAPNGAHLPSTLYRLAHRSGHESDDIYASIANRLAELIDDVRLVRVERDATRELLTLQVQDRVGTYHSARSLSDGTLRFLALAVLQEDPEARGVWCLEEPENGLHPARVPAMMALLRDIAADTERPVGHDNPLRQVVINTHSPGVVQNVPDGSLLAAMPTQVKRGGIWQQTLRFQAMEETWRTNLADPPAESLAKGWLLDYLNRPPPLHSGDGEASSEVTRVIDRPDVRQLLRQYDLFDEE